MKPEEQIWREFDVIEQALGGDILYLEESLVLEDSPTLRRGYCRAVFAYAEGIAGWMRRYTIQIYYPGTLGKDEKRDLERRNGALQRIFTAFDLFTDTAGARTPLRVDSKEWRALKSALKIRNRITHPETVSDVLISDRDIAEMRAARELITDMLAHIFSESGAALLHRAKGVRVAFKRIKAQEEIEKRQAAK